MLSAFEQLESQLFAALVLIQLPLSTLVSLGIALSTLSIAPSLFPSRIESAASNTLPRQDLLFRMLAGAFLTVAVTSLSSTIGASWSGLLAVFPILGIVLAVFSHRTNGALFAVSLLKAMASGLYSFVAFCFVLAVLLPSQNMFVSFSGATAVAAAVQWAVKVFFFQRGTKADA